MILGGRLASDGDVRRFQIDAQATANLDHPGIVPIYEVGEHEGQHYFSMGFIEGESLAQIVARGPMPPREAARLVRVVAETVEYAHERGVIHRDLKPANVLLDSQGRPRVIRLWPRQDDGRRGPGFDGDGASDGHAQLHAARAGIGRSRQRHRPAGRRLCAGGDPVLPGDGPAAVSGFQPDRDSIAGAQARAGATSPAQRSGAA